MSRSRNEIQPDSPLRNIRIGTIFVHGGIQRVVKYDRWAQQFFVELENGERIAEEDTEDACLKAAEAWAEREVKYEHVVAPVKAGPWSDEEDDYIKGDDEQASMLLKFGQISCWLYAPDGHASFSDFDTTAVFRSSDTPKGLSPVERKRIVLAMAKGMFSEAIAELETLERKLKDP